MLQIEKFKAQQIKVVDAEKMEVAFQVMVDGKQTGFSIRVFESDKTLKGDEFLNNIKQGLMTKFDLKEDQIKFTGMLVLYSKK